jgi:Tol biopolymer transport system component
VTGVTKYISRNPATGTVSNTGFNSVQAISADGRYVAFLSRGTNLVNGVTSNGASQIYLYDHVTDTLRMVTTNAAGTAGETTGSESDSEFQPQFSADGKTLLFVHVAGDMIAGVTDTNNTYDVFTYDTASGAKTLVSASTTANTAGDRASGQTSDRPRISAAAASSSSARRPRTSWRASPSAGKSTSAT